MPNSLTTLAASVLLLSLAACLQVPGPDGTSTPQKIATSPSNNLQAFMDAQGRQRIELEYMVTSHMLLQVSINASAPCRFVCDTGAGVSVISPELAKELNLVGQSLEGTAGGIGGDQIGLQSVPIDSLRINGVSFQDKEFLVMDLADLNDQFAMAGEAPIDGIIGAPWLTEHGAVIDMAGQAIFFTASQ